MKCPHCNGVIGIDIRKGDDVEISLQMMEDMSIDFYVRKHLNDIQNLRNKEMKLNKEQKEKNK